MNSTDVSGLCEVVYMDGEAETLDLEGLWVNGESNPVYITTTDGVLYNWMGIFSIKPLNYKPVKENNAS